MGTVSHLYIHIPFCSSRCDYCDFFSTVYRPEGGEGYLTALKKELAASRPQLGPLETIYIGGGTPSLAGESFLVRLLGEAAALAAPGAEITIEANPESIDAPLARALADGGVTRVSLGAQSFQPHLRRRIGRHGEADAIAVAAAAVRAAGIERLSLDLLFALPGQTEAELADDLDRALDLAPGHISCYELTVKRESDIAMRWPREPEVGREGAARFYELVTERLEAAGYAWYETSNYARVGHECRHNMAYWRAEDYIGIGAGSWSTVGERRWRNVEDIGRYLRDFAADRTVEVRDGRQQRVEALMLGLRTREGVTLETAGGLVDAGQLETLVGNGFIARDGARILLTGTGRFVANEVCVRLMRDVEGPAAGRSGTANGKESGSRTRPTH